MKKFLLVLLLMANLPAAKAQVVARLFYNKDWLLTKRDSAIYFRVAVMDTANQIFVGPVKDFTQDGKLLMTGSYFNGERHGLFVSYYRNGTRESEGTCTNDRRTGIWRYFYPNGGLKYLVNFDGKVAIAIEARDSTGTVVLKDGTGLWDEQYREIGTGITMTVKGRFTNHLSDGTWTQSLPDGTIWSEETFKEGVFVEGYVIADSMRVDLTSPNIEILWQDNKHWRTRQFSYTKYVTAEDYPYIKRIGHQHDQGDEVFTIVEISARPDGGMAAFYKAVADAISYPKDARRMGIQGRVFVEFIIGKDGKFTDIKVIKGLGAGLDEEAIRVVKESQKKVKWYPGVQGRKRVRMRYTLPIIFRLG